LLLQAENVPAIDQLLMEDVRQLFRPRADIANCCLMPLRRDDDHSHLSVAAPTSLRRLITGSVPHQKEIIDNKLDRFRHMLHPTEIRQKPTMVIGVI